ncbi:hypothetical protein NFI95_08170 [Acetobacteraceae bacterium KSS8]|uniref:Secreted protein n=1 Tax=Endosaccharibacter trunci TaxID=2812733 RepID=A0ABT1W6E6_9PROT|nr:hypothetical protein [Acetobacteraceae bacterium KSS8]
MAPAPQVAIAPDPYGYLKQSAVCTLGPVKTDPAGNRVVQMSVRSDDGRCAVAVAQPDRTAYASFVLLTLPAHGKAMIHNYNNQTLVDYTPTTAYAGPDSFTVSLIPSATGPRTTLRVDATVDATGVVVPPPPVVAAPPPSTTGKSSHTTHHHARHKSS